MMEVHDFQVKTAQNGHQALEAVKQSLAQKSPFDLIILDLNMPISNGYEACIKIITLYKQINIFDINTKEREPSPNGCCTSVKPLIVALSSYVDEPTYKESMKAGFELVYSSPI